MNTIRLVLIQCIIYEALTVKRAVLLVKNYNKHLFVQEESSRKYERMRY